MNMREASSRRWFFGKLGRLVAGVVLAPIAGQFVGYNAAVLATDSGSAITYTVGGSQSLGEATRAVE
jgi:hypothetical protein